MAGVGSPPSYSAVEELKRRLRSVPETVITHFLVKCDGNIDACYEQLKDGNWRDVDLYRLESGPQHPGDYRLESGPQHPGDYRLESGPQHPGDYRLESVPQHPGDYRLESGPQHPGDYRRESGPQHAGDYRLESGPQHPGDYRLESGPQHPGDYTPGQPPAPSHHSPPDSHTSRTPVLHRSTTYGPGLTYNREPSHAHTLAHAHAHAHPPPSERLEETWPIPGATWSPGLRHTSRPLAAQHHPHPYPHPHPHASPTKYPVAPPEFHIDNHVGTQRMQLERFQKSRDELVHNLSVLKNDADGKKHRLSSLRLRVSQGPTHQDVNQIRDVITTLQYDIQQAKNKVELEKVQDVMKKNRDIYTEEGVRWQCGHCTFLNHPLMTRCESCDLPKMSSSKPRPSAVTS